MASRSPNAPIQDARRIHEGSSPHFGFHQDANEVVRSGVVSLGVPGGGGKNLTDQGLIRMRTTLYFNM